MSNPLASRDRAGLSRLRDYLYDNGPTSVIEVAAALDMSPARVSRLLADGSVAPAAPAGGGDRRCAACGRPAAVNDLCRDCRRAFREAVRAGGA